ncbi:MAG: redoxin domain-containing protein, partial [Planctomycetaceae bacterium]
MRTFLLCAVIVFTGFLTIPHVQADETATDQKNVSGRTVANFTLEDFRGKEVSLGDFADRDVIVITFLGTECPLARLYTARLVQLHQEFSSQSVAFLAIDSNRQDSLTELAAHARDFGVEFPLLKDAGNKVADAIGATRTPEVFVLDKSRAIRYWGRIDDQYAVGEGKPAPTSHDLKRAVEELLAGQEISQPHIPVEGCLIGRVRTPKEESAVTYSSHIAKIFQDRCVECHRAGEIAPFTLTDYDEVAGWAETIAEVVEKGRMPPWHADPEFGHFSNDRSMPAEEKELILAWVKNGAPAGDLSNLPAPREFTPGWQLRREPDVVLTMREVPYDVPAEGTVEYQYFTVDTKFTEDRYITAAEVVPGNRAVVHHVVVFVRPPENADRKFPGDTGFLVAYVPGLRMQPLPDGMAKRIPAGSQLLFQMHYTPIGTPQQDMSKLGLIFAEKEDVKELVVTMTASQRNFRIPPHDANYKLEDTTGTLPIDVKLLSVAPHMHLRGKSFSYEAIFSDQRRLKLLNVPNYDFNWQTSYRLAEPLDFPAGTRMFCVATYDNSEDNLSNPDPSQTVTYGEQTWEEMMFGYFDIAIPIQKAEEIIASAPLRNQLARNPKALTKVIIERLDKNADGKIGLDEIPDDAGKARFKLADANADGEVTEEELLAAIKN